MRNIISYEEENEALKTALFEINKVIEHEAIDLTVSGMKIKIRQILIIVNHLVPKETQYFKYIINKDKQ